MANNKNSKCVVKDKCERFVSMVASMEHSDNADDSVDTINRLIQEARRLLS